MLLQYFGLSDEHWLYGVSSEQVCMVVPPPVPPPPLVPPPPVPPPPVPPPEVQLESVVHLLVVAQDTGVQVLVCKSLSIEHPPVPQDEFVQLVHLQLVLSFFSSSLSFVLVFWPTMLVGFVIFSSFAYFCWNLVTAALVLCQ